MQKPKPENQLKDPQAEEAKGLGMFAGVFTPSVLTILGIILFLRLGYVVGSAGLGRALIIIALANAISVLTSFSLAAVATNLKVKGGGDYYLISRTLGVEFGGAIGLVLFLAQSVSIGFYCLGFGEALAAMLGPGPSWTAQALAAGAMAGLFILAWLGADVATRFQFVIMAALALALASFFGGGLANLETSLLTSGWAAPSGGPGFWILFAIFFPAVTGFTQGVSMSGDLRDPGRSLPLGTFLAVGVSIVVYFGAALVFAGVLPLGDLAGDYGAMKRVSMLPVLVDAGVIAATLSSAMASFLGAPRILQSVARDRIIPVLNPFAKGAGASENPRRGVLLSGCIALATIGLGELNLIAPVVSMFFLVSYGLLNYATYYESSSKSPSFRPRFKFYHYTISLLGALACLGAILAIDLASGLVAVAVLMAIYQYLARSAGPARWADSRRSHYLQQVRQNLLAASREAMHPRNWRPLIIALSDHPERRKRLLRFSGWLEGGSGMTSLVRILEGEGPAIEIQRRTSEAELATELNRLGSDAFPLAVVSRDLDDGFSTLLQAHGIGPLRPNLVLLNWPENISESGLRLRELRYGRSLRSAFRLGVNIVILDAKLPLWQALEKTEAKDRRIDVWWWGDATSRLMLLLAYLITRSQGWQDASIRVLAQAGKTPRAARESLSEILDEARIPAEIVLVDEWEAYSVPAYSAESTLVFLPFKLNGSKVEDPFGKPLAGIVALLPLAALVLAAEDLDLDAEPEEGKVAEVAAALDALAKAEKTADQAHKDALELQEEASEKIRLSQDPEAVFQGEWIGRMRQALLAKEQAGKAARRAAKALAKVDNAARLVESLGLAPKRDNHGGPSGEDERG